MQKDFDTWNEVKKRIDRNTSYFPPYHEREVHWCALGANVGYEQDGTGSGYSRPVLILKGFSRYACLVVPLTTSKKENPYHVPLGDINGREAFAIISQVRLVDTRRLGRHLVLLDRAVFECTRNAVKAML